MNQHMTARVRETFNVKPLAAPATGRTLRLCEDAYRGTPDWLSPPDEGGVRTVNFAKSVCSETARLATLGVKITVGGSPRAEWLQQQMDREYFNLRHWVERACACGTAVLKPNGRDVDLVTPDRFVVTDTAGGEITGAVFADTRYDQGTQRWYTRLEYHRFDDAAYLVSNRCFVGDSEQDPGRPVDIGNTPWSELADEVRLTGLEKPLFGVLRMPGANNRDPGSPFALPIFADALEELRDLDVAYSRNADEVYDSRRISLLDDSLTQPVGTALGSRPRIRLPRFVRNVFGSGGDKAFYQEIDPALNTPTRLQGIDALLSQIGYKCGFSNGYFVFNERSGVATATQVEADDRRTIQLVKDVRDKLESALTDLLAALDAFADAYNWAPAGAYEPVFDFGDITYNREEDRARWWGYVVQGKAPFWYFLTKFEGFAEEEARQLEASAAPEESVPFGDEE